MIGKEIFFAPTKPILKDYKTCFKDYKVTIYYSNNLKLTLVINLYKSTKSNKNSSPISKNIIKSEIYIYFVFFK